MRIANVHRCLVLLAAALLTACASSSNVREYLDPSTAVTVTVAQRGWIFARERPDLAVHAQDYVTVTPVQVNRNGQRTVYVYCQLWSTIDRISNNTMLPPKAELALLADDRLLALPTLTTTPRSLGFGIAPVNAPNNATELRIVSIDPEWLRFALNANRLQVRLKDGATVEYFEIWRDAREASDEFLRRIAPTP